MNLMPCTYTQIVAWYHLLQIYQWTNTKLQLYVKYRLSNRFWCLLENNKIIGKSHHNTSLGNDWAFNHVFPSDYMLKASNISIYLGVFVSVSWKNQSLNTVEAQNCIEAAINCVLFFVATDLNHPFLEHGLVPCYLFHTYNCHTKGQCISWLSND